jgi:F-type H+-transporting ATPase subunit epsilon
LAGSLLVRVISPETVVFEGEASAVVAPAWDGKIGILPGHAPLLSLLGSGDLSLELPGGGTQTFFVAGGAVKVEAGRVTVLTEYAGAEPPAEIPASAVLHIEDTGSRSSTA